MNPSEPQRFSVKYCDCWGSCEILNERMQLRAIYLSIAQSALWVLPAQLLKMVYALFLLNAHHTNIYRSLWHNLCWNWHMQSLQWAYILHTSLRKLQPVLAKIIISENQPNWQKSWVHVTTQNNTVLHYFEQLKSIFTAWSVFNWRIPLGKHAHWRVFLEHLLGIK